MNRISFYMELYIDLDEFTKMYVKDLVKSFKEDKHLYTDCVRDNNFLSYQDSYGEVKEFIEEYIDNEIESIVNQFCNQLQSILKASELTKIAIENYLEEE